MKSLLFSHDEKTIFQDLVLYGQLDNTNRPFYVISLFSSCIDTEQDYSIFDISINNDN